MLCIVIRVRRLAGRLSVLAGLVLIISMGAEVNAAFVGLDSLRLSPQTINFTADTTLPQDIQALEQASVKLGFDRDTTTEYTAYGNSQITPQPSQATDIYILFSRI